jgi:ribosomal-protein-alanine N-acetyltransferase
MTADELNLATARLKLTPLTSRDLEAVWPGVSNPIVSEHMSWSTHKNKEETLRFLERVESDLASGRAITWGIRSEGQFCGIFSIINILRTHRALRYDRGELAYWCSPEHQLKGIMTEAGRSVIGFAFIKLGLNRLVVGHHMDNVPSQKLIERLGFKPIGIEHQAFLKDGPWIDIRTYELLARDYGPAA